MIQDIIRAVVTRVLQDKILMGLVIVGILGIFVGGNCLKDEPTVDGKAATAAMPANHHEAGATEPQAQGQGETKAPQAAETKPAQAPLDPQLAGQFVAWLMVKGMDYNAQTATKNHHEAFAWMTPEASQMFQAYFFPPALAQGIEAGQMAAAFQPISTMPVAVNPDGTVVVNMTGTLVMQTGPRPVTHQIIIDFLVRQDPKGLHIANLCNRSVVVPTNTVY